MPFFQKIESSREYMLYGVTTNATPKVITFDQSVASGTNQISVPAASGMDFTAVIVGLSGAIVFRQGISGTIKTTGGTTALVGSLANETKRADSGANTWTAVVTADNVNKVLAVTVTGQAATTINWFAIVKTIEVA